MSSSDPLLPVGEGMPDVHVGVGTAYLPGETLAPPPVALLDGDELSDDTGPHEPLPPLLSLGDLVEDAPPWLLSAALHMLLVIILGLLFIAQQRRPELLLRFDYVDSPGDEAAGGQLDMPLELDSQNIEEMMTLQELPAVEDPFAVEPAEITPVLDHPLGEVDSPIRMALSGRERGMQQGLLDAYGGNATTQQAVMEALKWLARNQQRDGSWNFTGPFSNGSMEDNPEAATALALLAFQGAGYTPDGDPQEPFTRVTDHAWTGLLKRQDKSGNFFHTGRTNSQLYTQAMCTIALCELYGMTHNSHYREPAQRAIDFCVKIQAPEGGWRYFPGVDSDLSVTGWFVMALQSAKMAGLEVPSSTLVGVEGFLDTVSRNGGSWYAYQQNQAASLSMSAEGLLCRQYLGWKRDDPRLVQGAVFLTENPPDWNDRNVYYWYYATQVCHHMEGSIWRMWNEVMRDLIPSKQEREGKERGSWDPRGDEWGNEGGRLFVTCLSVYMLEVYYRHLPIYQLELLGGGG